MTATLLTCPGCGTPLGAPATPGRELSGCVGCGRAVRIEVFPAFFRSPATGRGGERILVEGEAGCFFHPDKRAVISCGGCGRFLCALCDVDLNGQHLCPGCLEVGKRKGTLRDLESSREVYDSAALSLALLPILLWPMTLVTAPLAAGMAVYSWFRPGSLIRTSRFRAVLALVLAGLQMAGWAIFFVVVILKRA